MGRERWAVSLVTACVLAAGCAGAETPSRSVATTAAPEADSGGRVPPQPEGFADPGGAETAIRWAFTHLLRAEVDPSQRRQLVDAGTADPVEVKAVIDKVATVVRGGQVEMGRVDLVDPDRADVTLRVTFDRPELPAQTESSFTGAAVLVGGSWRVSADTACTLAIAANLDCARTPDDPTSPSALHLGWTEPGLHVITDRTDCPDVVNLDDQRAWGGPSRGFLHLSTTQLTGLSHLTGAQLDMVLPVLVGWTTAERTTSGGRPALTLTTVNDDPPQRTTWLASVRADDVLVVASASNFSPDELNAAVNSLEPTAPSTCPVMLPID